MAVLALILAACYLLVTFVLRGWLQVRTTGDSGFRGVSGRPGSAEWWSGALFVVAVLAALLSPVTALLGLAPLPGLESATLGRAGLALAASDD